MALPALLLAAALAARTNVGALACTAVTLSCNTTVDGELAPGDCVASDGSHYDVYRFQGSIGQVITASVLPLSSGLTAPYLELDTPPGDASGTPFVGGAGTPTLRFGLTSNGGWTIYIGTLNPAEAGPYRLSLQCANVSLPPGEPYCVSQPFSCGQIADWFLEPGSCKFSDGTTVFASYVVTTTAGAPLDFRLHSDDFDPGVAIYHNGGMPIASGFGRRFSTDARVNFVTPAAGTYEIAVFSANNQNTGEFTLNGECPAPTTCVPPSIVDGPHSTTVIAGGSTSLSVTAAGTAPLSYSWHDSINGPVTIGTSATLPVIGLTRTTSYSVDVSNACGTVTSAVATVTVKAARHRPSKH